MRRELTNPKSAQDPHTTYKQTPKRRNQNQPDTQRYKYATPHLKVILHTRKARSLILRVMKNVIVKVIETQISLLLVKLAFLVAQNV